MDFHIRVYEKIYGSFAVYVCHIRESWDPINQGTFGKKVEDSPKLKVNTKGVLLQNGSKVHCNARTHESTAQTMPGRPPGTGIDSLVAQFVADLAKLSMTPLQDLTQDGGAQGIRRKALKDVMTAVMAEPITVGWSTEGVFFLVLVFVVRC